MHLSDLSFLFFGRTGIYLSNGAIGLGMFAMSALFYVFFAQTLLSIIYVPEEEYGFAKAVTIIALTVLQTPVTLKRQISEFRVQRYFSPTGVSCVIFVLATQLGSEVTAPAEPSDLISLVHSFNIVVTAYGFLINLYPIYDKLEPQKRTHGTILLASGVALSFGAFVYLAFSLMSAEVFGMGNL